MCFLGWFADDGPFVCLSISTSINLYVCFQHMYVFLSFCVATICVCVYVCLCPVSPTAAASADYPSSTRQHYTSRSLNKSHGCY